MNREVVIQRLGAEHITAAVKLVRTSFEPNLLPYMVYGQTGIQRYIEALQPIAGLASGREMFVALDSEQVVGFAEFDLRSATAAHLAYVCVAASQRGRGIARRMISQFASENRDRSALSLDVFESNTVARSLYQGLGLEEHEPISEWRVRPLPQAVDAQISIEDFAQSSAVHSAFGFSSLRVHRAKGQVVLGRLGDRCLRVSSTMDFLDDELLASVRGVFPRASEALLITPADQVAGSRVAASEVLTRSIRMSGRLGSALTGGV